MPSPYADGMPDYRAHFDFDIAFVNGGGRTGRGFRLDVPHADVDDEAVARLLITHLGLALVEEVAVRSLRIVREPHRGSRGVDVAADDAGDATAERRIVDLSHIRPPRRSRPTSPAKTPVRVTRPARSSPWM